MNSLVQVGGFLTNSSIPAYLRRQVAVDIQGDIAAGLPTGSWPKISIGGGRFTLQHADKTDEVLRSFELDVIILRGNPKISHRYYENDFNLDDAGPPDCWADDGIGPGPRVAAPKSPTGRCDACPMDKWGSAISKVSGAAIKACKEIKKLSVLAFAVGPDMELLPGPFEFDVPTDSLKNLAEYVRLLNTNNTTAAVVVTRISFVTDVTYPKVKFTAVRYLSEEEAAAAERLRDTEEVLLQLGMADAGARVQMIPAPARVPEPMPPPVPVPGRIDMGQGKSEHNIVESVRHAETGKRGPGRPRKEVPPPAPDPVVNGMFKKTAPEDLTVADIITPSDSRGAVVMNPEPASAAVDKLLDGIFD